MPIRVPHRAACRCEWPARAIRTAVRRDDPAGRSWRTGRSAHDRQPGRQRHFSGGSSCSPSTASRRTRIAATSLAIAALAAPAAQARPALDPPAGRQARERAAALRARRHARPRTAASTGARPASARPPARASCSSGGSFAAHLSRPGAPGPLRLGGRVARGAGARDHRGVPAGELIGRERELASLTAMLGDPEAAPGHGHRPGRSGQDAPGAGGVRGGRARPAGRRRARRPRSARGRAAGGRGDRGRRRRRVVARASALEAAAAALRDGRALLVLDNFEHVEPAAADLGAAARRVPGGDGARHEPPRPRALGRAHAAAGAAEHARRGRRRRAGQRRRRALRRARPGAGPELRAHARGRRVAWRRSAGAWTACRWRSSSPPPAWRVLAPAGHARALGRGGRARHRRARATCRRASGRCAARSTGATTCSSADEQALLRRLAAFPGGFDVQAVEAAQRGDGGVLAPLELDPISTLAALVDRSLLYREAGSAAEPRFSMLVTVRSYLRERLAEAGEETAADLWMAHGVRRGGASAPTASSAPASRATSSTGSTASSTTSELRSTCWWRASRRARWTSEPICFASGAHVTSARGATGSSERCGPAAPTCRRPCAPERSSRPRGWRTSRATTVLGAAWRTSAWRRRSRPTTR